MQIKSDQRVETRTRVVHFSAIELNVALREFVLERLNIDDSLGHVKTVVEVDTTDRLHRGAVAVVTVIEDSSQLPQPARP